MRVRHRVPLAGFCLSLYGLHALNRDVNMIQTNKQTNPSILPSICPSIYYAHCLVSPDRCLINYNIKKSKKLFMWWYGGIICWNFEYSKIENNLNMMCDDNNEKRLCISQEEYIDFVISKRGQHWRGHTLGECSLPFYQESTVWKRQMWRHMSKSSIILKGAALNREKICHMDLQMHA